MSKPVYESVKTRKDVSEHLALLESAVANARKDLEWWQMRLSQFKKEKKK